MEDTNNEVQPDADVRAKDERMEEDEERGTRPTEDRMKAAATKAHALWPGRAALMLTWVRTSPNPYRDDDADTVDIYEDRFDFEYWFETGTGHLVNAAPSARVYPAPRYTRPEDRQPVAVLREIAVKIVTAHIPDFAARRSSFHPLEDNRKRETYFFRWDNFNLPAPENELPPFVQVGLHADGTLASFVNTMRAEIK